MKLAPLLKIVFAIFAFTFSGITLRHPLLARVTKCATCGIILNRHFLSFQWLHHSFHPAPETCLPALTIGGVTWRSAGLGTLLFLFSLVQDVPRDKETIFLSALVLSGVLWAFFALSVLSLIRSVGLRKSAVLLLDAWICGFATLILWFTLF